MKTLTSLLILASLAASLGAAPFEGWPGPDGKWGPWAKPAPKADKTQAWPFKGGRALTLKVGAEKLADITPWHFGNNASWWMHKDFAEDQGNLDKARAAGLRFWRWPGGSSSDEYVWDGSYAAFPKPPKKEHPEVMNGDWAVRTDDFVTFCRALGAQAIFTANYGMARYGSLEDAVQLASSWVLRMNLESGFPVRHWEIGNECYGNWEAGHEVPGKARLDGGQYGRDFKAFARAMKAVDPSIYLGAVALPDDDGTDWVGYRWWMRDMLPEAAPVADYLVLHEYFVWPFESDGKTLKKLENEALFANVGKIGKDMESLRAILRKRVPERADLPVALTEYNLVNASPPQTIQLINTLFTGEVLGEMIRAGFVASNYWDWRNGKDSLGGDMGMLASSDSSVPDNTPRPSYYAFAVWERAGGTTMVKSEGGDAKFKAWATRFPGGETGVILSNEAEEGAELTLEGLQASSVLGWVVDGQSLNSAQVRFNGVPGPQGGGGPFPLEGIQPYAKSFAPGKPLKVSLPPRSLSGLVLR